MPKMTRGDSKVALAQQRSQLRRGAHGKTHVGDDTGSAAGLAAERAKVRRMRERQQQLLREERLRQPLAATLIDLAIGGAKLAGTLVVLPFRIAQALRGHASRAAEA